MTHNKYPWYTPGYNVIASKATSHNQGGVALLWKEGDDLPGVEAACIVMPNLLTFQLITDVERFYVMGIYIPPNDSLGVNDLRAAWNLCPADCVPLILGDLNINFKHPQDYREEAIADLVDETLSTHLGNSPFTGPGCKERRYDGHGVRSDWGDGINPSLTTFWYGRRKSSISGRWHSGRPWSIIRVTGRSLLPMTTPPFAVPPGAAYRIDPRLQCIATNVQEAGPKTSERQ